MIVKGKERKGKERKGLCVCEFMWLLKLITIVRMNELAVDCVRRRRSDGQTQESGLSEHN